MEQNNIDNDPLDNEIEQEPYIITNVNIKTPKKQVAVLEIISLILGALSLANISIAFRFNKVIIDILSPIGLILLAISKSQTKVYSNIGVIGLVCCIFAMLFFLITLLSLFLFTSPW